MNVGNVQEYKLQIGEKEYTFRLDFKALMKFNERYKDYKTIMNGDKEVKVGAFDIFNDYLKGNNTYDCIVKILSCSCTEKELTEEELLSSLSFDFPTMKILDLISNKLVQGSLVLEKGKDKNENSSKKN